MFVLGLIRIQRRSLEIVIEANSSTSDEKINIQTLVSKRNIYQKGPKIVIIGGGTGLSNMLTGLKNYTSNITAIVTVSSYGELKSEGEKELNLVPIEDIKESIVALSLHKEEMSRLMDYKFNSKKLKGISFGEIYLAAMQNVYGEFAKSIEKSSDILGIVGKVLPVTLDEMKICAELKDGTIVEERSKISDVVTDKVTEINRVYITPSNCRTAPGIVEAIKDADCIIIGPGSLYTNVIPNLLIKNVAKSIKDSKAHKVYVSNIMTEPGQTDDYTVADHIKAIIEHAGEDVINHCLCDTGEVVPEILRKYNLEGSNLVDSSASKIRDMGINVIKREYATIDGEYIRHNPDEIASTIIELILDELKFKDIKPDEQFVLLDTKLKQARRSQKKKSVGKRAKVDIKKKTNRFKSTSKFANKYEERIESIRNTEKTRQQNIKIHKKAEKITNKAEQEEKEKFLKETYKR
ncbi:MAG: YvcK family protein [Oscillospiraceae bacterium]|nr:YvcK family protein [Oscillospiraceae bacterium]